jgi:hypothetical protein
MAKNWHLAVPLTAILGFGEAHASLPKQFESPANPFALYGDEIYFDVYRKGTKVGFHRVRFDGTATDLTVSTEFKLQIDIFFITAFRYSYVSEEKWRNGRLEGLTADTDDDGTISAVNASWVDETLRIENRTSSVESSQPLFPTTHWNAGVVTQSQVLNTITGGIDDVQIEPTTTESVMTERGAVEAIRYTYSGDLQNEVWYDQQGRWVKMRFTGTDGSLIEYVCKRCQGATGASSLR